MKRLSQAQLKTLEYENFREIICSALGWNTQPDQWFWFMLECGVLFIEKHTRDYDQARELLVGSREIYWNWWVNQWNMRDEEFFLNYELFTIADLSEELTPQCIEYMQLFYKDWHGEGINSDVMETGWANVVGKVIKQLYTQEHTTTYEVTTTRVTA